MYIHIYIYICMCVCVRVHGCLSLHTYQGSTSIAVNFKPLRYFKATSRPATSEGTSDAANADARCQAQIRGPRSPDGRRNEQEEQNATVLSMNLSIYLSICLSMYLSIHLNIYRFICLRIYIAAMTRALRSISKSQSQLSTNAVRSW